MWTLTLGMLVGVVMGLTGAGGGILAVPLLVFGLGMSVAEAGPIGLLAVAASATVGAVAGLRDKTVRYRAAAFVAAVGMLAAPVGQALAARIDVRLLSVLFAVVLLWVAYRTARDAVRPGASGAPAAGASCVRDAAHGRFVWTSRCAGVLASAGAAAGLLSGLLGVGGGFVMVPALQRYTDLPARAVVTTALAVVALVALAGVASHMVAGTFDAAAGLPFALGSVVGMAGGSLVARRLAPHHLKLGFAAVCLVVAGGMLLSALRATST